MHGVCMCMHGVGMGLHVGLDLRLAEASIGALLDGGEKSEAHPSRQSTGTSFDVCAESDVYVYNQFVLGWSGA